MTYLAFDENLTQNINPNSIIISIKKLEGFCNIENVESEILKRACLSTR